MILNSVYSSWTTIFPPGYTIQKIADQVTNGVSKAGYRQLLSPSYDYCNQIKNQALDNALNEEMSIKWLLQTCRKNKKPHQDIFRISESWSRKRRSWLLVISLFWHYDEVLLFDKFSPISELLSFSSLLHVIINMHCKFLYQLVQHWCSILEPQKYMLQKIMSWSQRGLDYNLDNITNLATAIDRNILKVSRHHILFIFFTNLSRKKLLSNASKIVSALLINEGILSFQLFALSPISFLSNIVGSVKVCCNPKNVLRNS